MDVWGMIFVGKQWTEDDGTQESDVYASEQFKVTMPDFPGRLARDLLQPAHGLFPVHWATLSAEVMNVVELQLGRMRDNLIAQAKAGKAWHKTHVTEEGTGEGPNPFYECPFCGILDPGDLVCSGCGKQMKPPEDL